MDMTPSEIRALNTARVRLTGGLLGLLVFAILVWISLDPRLTSTTPGGWAFLALLLMISIVFVANGALTVIRFRDARRRV